MKTTISFAIFTIRLRTKVNTFRASSYISFMALPVKKGLHKTTGKKSLKAWLKALNKKH